MIIVYWKWKLWNSAKNLLDYLWIENNIIDDTDFNEQLLENAEKIIISPWIPQTHTIYSKYKNKIIWDYDFCYNIMKEKWIIENSYFFGITWTDWKSTVTRIVYCILEEIFKNNSLYKVWIWWNYDKPITKILQEILEWGYTFHKNIFVLEMSSFMCYNLKKMPFDYSIWTNFEKDHLNWHPNMKEYFEAKKNLITNTVETSYVHPDIITKINLPNVKAFSNNYNLEWTHFTWEHNKQNLNSCFQIIKQYIVDTNLNITDTTLQNIIKNIKPLPHRIQFIKEINWIKIYDDGKSTTANSLKAAINSFDEKIILIAGWSDKWDDFSVLKNDFKQKVCWASLLGQTAPIFSNILNELNIKNQININMANTITYAYNLAIEKNSKIILFSPGCASFDLFKNREDRVEQFLMAINNLQA